MDQHDASSTGSDRPGEVERELANVIAGRRRCEHDRDRTVCDVRVAQQRGEVGACTPARRTRRCAVAPAALRRRDAGEDRAAERGYVVLGVEEPSVDRRERDHRGEREHEARQSADERCNGRLQRAG
jgi:hypothetical protein